MADSDTLVPITVPPGLFHNGTRQQATGRWYDGSGVRFHQGTVQPIGGWVKRTLTGATISGVPNAAVSWESAKFGAFIAVGTSTGLYAIGSTNVVHALSLPGGFVGQTPFKWTLKVFGWYLFAIINADTLDLTFTRNVFVWDGNLAAGTTISYADNGTGTLPFYVYSGFTTPERFCVLLRGADTAGHRMMLGGAILGPPEGVDNGKITLQNAGGTPIPVGKTVFDGANGGLRF